MEWTEVKIYTTRQGVEPVSATIIEAGVFGVQIEDSEELKEYLKESSKYWDYVEEELLNKTKSETIVKFYVSNNHYGNEIFLNIKENLKYIKSIENEININLGSLKIETTENLDDEQWLNKWKEFYKPFKIGEKIIVKPIWEEFEATEKIIFNINPGPVFGTGLHQTTKLCVENIEKYVNTNSIVLDLGCGSGILSVISLLLGAKEAVAVDIDENAIKVAYENAQINNISKDKYFVTSGDIITDINLQNQILNKKYSLVLANIIADVICKIAPFVKKSLEKEGIFICSGIISSKLDDVYNSLKENDLKVLHTFTKDDWICIVAQNS